MKDNIFKNLSLSVYAFGYGCGFVRDPRPGSSESQAMSLADVVEIASINGLGGVEIPVDRYFPDPAGGALKEFIRNCAERRLRVIFALERFSSIYFNALAPVVRDTGLPFVRAKVCDFYGGNRHLEASYKTQLAWFSDEVARCVDAVDRSGVRILVENHQDITLADIFSLVSKFGEARIGINWDTGNSFPTGETTSSFMSKAGHLIGNVHLKDYRVSRSNLGYSMHRCVLGQGIVELERIIPALKTMSAGHMPFTIELAAFIRRTAHIDDDRYWLFTPGVSPAEIATLKETLYTRCEDENAIASLFEKGASPADIAAREAVEVANSIDFCKDVIRNHRLSVRGWEGVPT